MYNTPKNDQAGSFETWVLSKLAGKLHNSLEFPRCFLVLKVCGVFFPPYDSIF